MEEQAVYEPEIIEEETGLQVKDSNKLQVKREILDYKTLIEMSTMLAKSTILPIQYQNRPENCFIMLDLASRMGVSPMVVAQNLFIIQGKPSWSGQAIASLIRSSEQFKNVELHYIGEEGKDNWGAYVTAERNGKTLKGASVTIKMAKAEGWYQKSGSKWQTMPELMLAYRAYTFFGRAYAPELLMGLHAVEEIEDITPNKSSVVNPFEK